MKAISWEGLREANAVVCVLCVGLTIIGGPTWIGVLDGIIAGSTGCAVVYITMIIRMRDHFRNLVVAMESMAELNQQLLSGKVEVIHRDHDSARPSVH